MNSIYLSDLIPGQKCRVIRIESGDGAGRRIAEMGLTPGTIIEVERVAPLGDPVEIKVLGYHLSMRKVELSCIEVAPL